MIVSRQVAAPPAIVASWQLRLINQNDQAKCRAAQDERRLDLRATRCLTHRAAEAQRRTVAMCRPVRRAA